MSDEVRLEASAVEALAVVHHAEGEASQAAGAHQEEAREEGLAQAQTEELQEVGEEGSAGVAEATKLLLYRCLHVAYAAFREIPTKDVRLAVSREQGVQCVAVLNRIRIILRLNCYRYPVSRLDIHWPALLPLLKKFFLEQEHN